MTDEEQQEDQQPEPAAQEDSQNLIDKANAAVKGLNQENERLEKNLARLEKLRVKDALGGKSEATSNQHEETAEEYTDRILKGDYGPRKK